MNPRRAVAAAAVAIAGLLAGSSGALARSAGDTQVMALIPPPGYPALPHVMGGNVYEGTYVNPQGSSMPSRVLEYSPLGELLNSWTVQRQDVTQAHGVQVAAHDARGRLLLFDRTSGRIIRLDPRTGDQSLYGTVPDLPTCASASAGQPCSHESQDMPPFPDYGAWGPDGSLYVTDYDQGVIFRIPPRGGAAQVWLSDPVLAGGMFGTACVLLMPDHRTLLFDQASNGDPLSGATNYTTGKLYEVAIQADGKPGPLKQLWESGPADAPDGCVLAGSGHIYVALAGGSNQIVELDSSGHELGRFGGQYSGSNNSPVPFDTPSGLAWLGTDLVVANQAFIDGNTANMALLNVETGEPGLPFYMPPNAGVAPSPPHRPGHKRHKKHKHKHKHHKKHKSHTR